MDYSKLTLLDCVKKWEQEREAAVIEDGSVKGFVKEKALTAAQILLRQ